MNLSEPFIRRPVMTVLLTVSAISVRCLAYTADAGERSAGGGLPGHQVNVRLSRRDARDDGQQRRHAAGTAVHADPRAGSWSPATAGRATPRFTLQFNLNKSIDAAATDVQTAITQANGQLADRSAQPADVQQDQSQRPADHVHRADQQHGHARPVVRLRQHPGRAAHQHRAGREPGADLRHHVGRAHQGRSIAARRPRDDDGRSGRGHSQPAPAIRAPVSSMAPNRTFLLQPAGAAWTTPRHTTT